MKGNRRTTGRQVLGVLISACLTQVSQAEPSDTPFKYSDEWSLVSAPPPAGPYQAVNIDPRVPGPGTIPELPMAIPRLHAQQPPADETNQDGSISAQADAAAVPEEQMNAGSGASPVMPPVPGHYQPVMPVAEGVPAAEAEKTHEIAEAVEQTAEPLPVIGAGEANEPAAAGQAGGEESVSEPAMAAEQELVPDMAGTEPVQQPLAETAGAAVTPEATVQEPASIASGEQPQVIEVEEPVISATPADQAPESVLTEAPAAAADVLPTEPPSPMAGGQPEPSPVAEQPATALQEAPYFESSQPGYYDRMMPPAAGRMTSEPPYPMAPGPADQLREQPMEAVPSGGYYGYGRPAPAPGYGYPAPGYTYQSARPGYWNMPPYGYPRAQEQVEGQDVPPPPVYDSMRYPRLPR